MGKKIAITGATGFLGRKLSRELIANNFDVIAVSRDAEKAKKLIPNAYNYVEWDYKSIPNFINGCDIIVHLAGENIMAKRWTKKHKENVIESRTLSTKSLIEGIIKLDVKLSAFICASGISYYGNSEIKVDESTSKGEGFLSDVVELWEREAAKVEKYNIRRISLRTGIVLDKNDGALKKMIPPFLFYIGGPLGSGKQWFPWIHIDDWIQIILHVIENKNVNGAVNVVSPNPVRMKDFALTLGEVIKRPALFRVTEFVLKIILGEAADSLIDGVNAYPQRLIDSGYQFKFDNLTSALRNIFNEKSAK